MAEPSKQSKEDKDFQNRHSIGVRCGLQHVLWPSYWSQGVVGALLTRLCNRGVFPLFVVQLK